MGNHISHRTAATTGKVILPEGMIQTLDHDNPTSVGELMLENPQHLVVEFHPTASKFRAHHTTNGTKASPLPADFVLDPAKIYVLVPMRRRGGKITVEEENAGEGLRRKSTGIGWSVTRLTLMMRCGGDYDSDAIVMSTNSLVVKNAGHPGFDMEEEKEVVMGEEEEEKEMKADFLSRQFSSKRWKPNLDSIEEKVLVQAPNTNKVLRWLF